MKSTACVIFPKMWPCFCPHRHELEVKSLSSPQKEYWKKPTLITPPLNWLHPLFLCPLIQTECPVDVMNNDVMKGDIVHLHYIIIDLSSLCVTGRGLPSAYYFVHLCLRYLMAEWVFFKEFIFLILCTTKQIYGFHRALILKRLTYLNEAFKEN